MLQEAVGFIAIPMMGLKLALDNVETKRCAFISKVNNYAVTALTVATAVSGLVTIAISGRTFTQLISSKLVSLAIKTGPNPFLEGAIGLTKLSASITLGLAALTIVAGTASYIFYRIVEKDRL